MRTILKELKDALKKGFPDDGIRKVYTKNTRYGICSKCHYSGDGFQEYKKTGDNFHKFLDCPSCRAEMIRG